MKKRSNNRGFTLVEIIIAVAILAVVISPLVANFIQSSRINLKGRKTLNAMNLAQDIMEGISGYTAEEVETVLDNYIADPTGAKPLAGTILPVSSQFDAAVKTSASGDDVLVYELDGVETISSARNKYDVKLTLNPTGTEHEEFNNKELADISEINQYYDAIYTYDAAELTDAIGQLYLASNYSVKQEAYRGNVIRTITVKIINSGTEANPKYKVTVVRNYIVNGSFAAQTGLTGKVITYTTDNISRMDEDKMPRSVYVYYQGIENASYNDNPRLDNIVIESTTGNEITVYLVRTQVEDESTNVAYGLTYGCDVMITSKDMMGANTEDVHIVSNLRYDLNAENMRYNFRDEDESGNKFDENTMEYPLDNNGDEMKTSSYMRERARYYYNGALIDETLYQSNFSAGYAKKEKNTLYKVLIEVYDVENGDKVATYDGGLSN